MFKSLILIKINFTQAVERIIFEFVKKNFDITFMLFTLDNIVQLVIYSEIYIIA